MLPQTNGFPLSLPLGVLALSLAQNEWLVSVSFWEGQWAGPCRESHSGHDGVYPGVGVVRQSGGGSAAVPMTFEAKGAERKNRAREGL